VLSHIVSLTLSQLSSAIRSYSSTTLP
jgi:hypothetical protein